MEQMYYDTKNQELKEWYDYKKNIKALPREFPIGYAIMGIILTLSIILLFIQLGTIKMHPLLPTFAGIYLLGYLLYKKSKTEFGFVPRSVAEDKIFWKLKREIEKNDTSVPHGAIDISPLGLPPIYDEKTDRHIWLIPFVIIQKTPKKSHYYYGTVDAVSGDYLGSMENPYKLTGRELANYFFGRVAFSKHSDKL